MKHSTYPPTKAQRARFEALRELGCVACDIEGIRNQEVDIHHIVEGRKRLGHDFTLPLCLWHHRGEPTGMCKTVHQARMVLGPSIARSKRDFIAHYGTERELLARVNSKLGA